MNRQSTKVENKASKLLEKAAAQIKRSTVSGNVQKTPNYATVPNNSDYGENHDAQLFLTSTPNSHSKVKELAPKAHGFEDENNTTIEQIELRSGIEENEIENITFAPKSKYYGRSNSFTTPSPAKNEYDEIQAYLQNLSKKTKTEQKSINKDNIDHEASESPLLSKSDLSLSLSELSLKGKAPPPNPSAIVVEKDLQISKVSAKANASAATTSRVPSSRVSTALERASFYDDKYRKTKNEQSKKDILDSDSDFSLNEFKAVDPTSPSKKLEPADKLVTSIGADDDSRKSDASEPVSLNKPDNSIKPSPLMELHNLHTVEELLESIDLSPAKVSYDGAKDSHDTVTSLSVPVSEIAEEFEELDESIDEVQTAGSGGKDLTPSAEDEVLYTAQSEFSVATVSNVDSRRSSKTNNSRPNDELYAEPLSESKTEPESDSSGKVFKNVYFGSLDEASQLSMKSADKNDEVVISSPTMAKLETKSDATTESKPLTPKKAISLDHTDRSHRSARRVDAAVQTIVGTSSSLTDLLMNPPLVNYTCELENVGSLAGVTRYTIRQETIEALISTSPGILAANDLLQQQLFLTTQFLASQQSLYSAHVSALQPDYSYTTLTSTKEEMRRYRRRQMLSRSRHKKRKE